MSDDLITSLRALAAARHDDLSIAVDAVIEIERLTRQRDEARAEIERQARHIEELREKIDAEGSCACSLDAPGDICAAHSPALMRARAEVERLTGKLKLVADALNETISKYDEVGDQNDRLDAENERLREALHRVSLASQNSMSSKDECGRIARETLEVKS